MRVRPGFGETLPALLRRRFGVPPPATLAGAGAAAALVAVLVATNDPLNGKEQRVHRGQPVFNTLYRDELVRPVAPRGDELQRYEARRGALRMELTIRPFRLPPYTGDAAGILPIHTQRHIEALDRRLPGFRLRAEGRARVNTAPGYEAIFRYGRQGLGADVFVVPPDEPGTRDGLLVSLRQRGPTRAAPKVRRAMRSTYRSFKYGADRDD